MARLSSKIIYLYIVAKHNIPSIEKKKIKHQPAGRLLIDAGQKQSLFFLSEAAESERIQKTHLIVSWAWWGVPHMSHRHRKWHDHVELKILLHQTCLHIAFQNKFYSKQ
jgi:ABC-type uncharacterized transport system permease subunit